MSHKKIKTYSPIQNKYISIFRIAEGWFLKRKVAFKNNDIFHLTPIIWTPLTFLINQKLIAWRNNVHIDILKLLTSKIHKNVKQRYGADLII